MHRAAAAAVVAGATLVASSGAAGRANVGTTVAVEEYDFGFRLTPRTVRAGRVTFVMRNTGAILHNFRLTGLRPGAFIGPRQTARMTLVLKPGRYTYVCDV